MKVYRGMYVRVDYDKGLAEEASKYLLSIHKGYRCYGSELKNIVEKEFIEYKKHIFSPDEKIKRKSLQNIPIIFEDCGNNVYVDIITGRKYSLSNYNCYTPYLNITATTHSYTNQEVINILNSLKEDDVKRYKQAMDNLNALAIRYYNENQNRIRIADNKTRQQEEYIEAFHKRFK